MVQKPRRAPSALPRRRGRPRAFEPDAALARAMDAFWKDGFAATSLDDLSAATGLNRPSLYGAFGDKRALYIQAYRRYREHVREAFAPLFAEAAPLRDKLRRILLTALDLYLSGEEGPRGCFTVLSASSDASLIRRSARSSARRSTTWIARSSGCSRPRGPRANFPPTPIRGAWR